MEVGILPVSRHVYYNHALWNLGNHAFWNLGEFGGSLVLCEIDSSQSSVDHRPLSIFTMTGISQ